MITASQFGGSYDLWTTPSGDVGVTVSISKDFNSHWFIRGTCPDIKAVPEGLGEGFSVNLGEYELAG